MCDDTFSNRNDGEVTHKACNDKNSRQSDKEERLAIFEDLMPLSFLPIATFASLLSIALYSNSLHENFVYDDKRAVLTNDDVVGGTPLSSIWRHDFWGAKMRMLSECFEDFGEEKAAWTHNSYRPLTVLTMRLDFELWGITPTGIMKFHYTNILIHAATVFLAAYFFSAIFGRQEMSRAGAASILFAVHPVHSEVVSNVTSRAETLSAFFSIAAMLVYVTSFHNKNKTSANFQSSKQCSFTRLSACFILIILGVVSKETALVVPAILLSFELAYATPQTDNECILNSSRSILVLIREFFIDCIEAIRIAKVRCSCVTTFAISLLIFRLKLISCGGYTIDTFLWLHNPMSDLNTVFEKFVAISHVQTRAVAMLFYPPLMPLAHEHIALPLVTKMYDIRNLATLAVWIISFFAIKKTLSEGYTRRHVRLLAFAIGVIAYLPSSHVLTSVAFVIAERTLFLPSIGAVILIVEALAVVGQLFSSKQAQIIQISIFGFLLTTFATQTYLRNPDWASENSLMNSNIAVYPTDNYMSRQGLGASAVYAGKVEEAKYYLNLNIELTKRWSVEKGRYLLEEPSILLSQLYWQHLKNDPNSYTNAINILKPLTHGNRYRTLILSNLGLLVYATQINFDIIAGKTSSNHSSSEEIRALIDAEREKLREAEYNILAAAEPTSIQASPALFSNHLAMAYSNAACIRLTSETSRWGHGILAQKLFETATEMAINLTPDNPVSDMSTLESVLHNHSIALAVAGQYDRAVNTLQRAVSLASYGAKLGGQKASEHLDLYDKWNVELSRLQSLELEVKSWTSVEIGSSVGSHAKTKMGKLDAACEVMLLWW